MQNRHGLALLGSPASGKSASRVCLAEALSRPNRSSTSTDKSSPKTRGIEEPGSASGASKRPPSSSVGQATIHCKAVTVDELYGFCADNGRWVDGAMPHVWRAAVRVKDALGFWTTEDLTLS